MIVFLFHIALLIATLPIIAQERDKRTFFKPDGSIRAIESPSESLRLRSGNSEEIVLLTTGASARRWTWRETETTSETFSGKLTRKDTSSLFPSGEWQKVRKQGDRETRQIYSPLGELVAEQITEKGRLIHRQSWQYNAQGQPLLWHEETPDVEQEITYHYQENQLIMETLKISGRVVQVTRHTGKSRIIERFSRQGENLGTFTIKDQEAP